MGDVHRFPRPASSAGGVDRAGESEPLHGLRPDDGVEREARVGHVGPLVSQGFGQGHRVDEREREPERHEWVRVTDGIGDADQPDRGDLAVGGHPQRVVKAAHRQDVADRFGDVRFVHEWSAGIVAVAAP